MSRRKIPPAPILTSIGRGHTFSADQTLHLRPPADVITIDGWGYTVSPEDYKAAERWLDKRDGPNRYIWR